VEVFNVFDGELDETRDRPVCFREGYWHGEN
jgi:hypothetical protein